MAEQNIAGNSFKVVCFKDIVSPSEVNQFLKEKHPNIVLLDAKIIISIRQIKTAVLNALALQKSNQMQCKTIYMEMLRCFSPDGRLNGAFKNCAVTESTKDVIGITLNVNDPIPEISGLGCNVVSVEEFFENHKPDINLLTKIFSITDEMLKTYSIEDIIITTLSVILSDLVRTHGA